MPLSRFTLPLAAASLVGLAACQQPLPGQTGQNTQQGAVIGAGLGAVAGALAGDRDDRVRNAAIGAAAGGALGAVVGNALDRQAAELRQELGPQIGVVNTGEQIVVTVPGDLLFPVDSATLTANQQASLRTVAASLNRYPNTRVNVIGHTDNTGTAAYNQNLSEQRARSVANALIAGGVAPQRITTIGRGFNQPVASNATPQGRQQNRRVEIIITPN